MRYPGTSWTYSHFGGPVNLKGFTVDTGTAPTTGVALTGVTSSDYVLAVGGIKFLSAAGAQPKLSCPTIAYSLGTNLIKFSNAMSNMAVWGIWIDTNA